VNKFISLSFFTLLLVFVSKGVSAQLRDKCGTVEYMRELRLKELLRESDNQFEKWLNDRITFPRNEGAFRKKEGPYQIPVVVHVIHNGEAEGSGTNISDAQIASQLKVLNNDFQRKNADASDTPAEFLSVAGSMDIEFILARRDPEGQSTSGIIRVDGNRSSWTSGDNYELKSLSYWPAEDYLNIWVCNITDYLGYAQFPVSDLPGLENSSENRLTDGLVIWHRSFGSIEDGDFDLDPDYNLGRTATHEISHFFGLRHTWGDVDGCTGTDYVDDTPNQDGHTSGCPTHPQTSCNPPVTAMFQNFLDYTDDACMNLFTQDQIDRMATVLETSPRRASLLVSTGLLQPDPVDNDAGLRQVVSPPATQCSDIITPSVLLKNYGKNYITSLRLRLFVDGVATETQDVSVNLAPLDSAIVTFTNLQIGSGTANITFEIIQVNGTADGDPVGNENIFASTVYIPEHTDLPLHENFDNLSGDWTIQNPDDQLSWFTTTVPDQTQTNKALVIPFFDYHDNIGELDILYTPIFDLTNAEEAVLYFDIAHAQFDDSHDAFRVVAITNCSTLSEGEVIFEKSGGDLATVPSTDAYFVPNGAEDWRTEHVDLGQFVDKQLIQLAFIGINGYGNNLYLDNISIATYSNDLSLREIVSPALVTCDGTVAEIRVQNTGTDAIHSFSAQYSVNGGSLQTATFNNLNIAPGKEGQFPLSSVDVEEGQNILDVTVTAPNTLTDDNPVNNSQSVKIVVNKNEDQIPLRLDFEGSFLDQWTVANPGTGMNWAITNTNYNRSLYFNSFNNFSIGDESWFVSPVLDFSRASSASMVFDLSYARDEMRKEDLRILVSADCGNTYAESGYRLPDAEIVSETWLPVTEDEWLNDQYVDLSAFAREQNVRIAFVVTNASGNNLYIDNIEFFLSKDQRNIVIEEGYTIFGYNAENFSESVAKIGFNLQERQNVKIEIIDTMGRLIRTIEWLDVLNQVFELPIGPEEGSAIYIVRVNIGGQYSSARIFLTR
jgi:hypothetical protein